MKFTSTNKQVDDKLALLWLCRAVKYYAYDHVKEIKSLASKLSVKDISWLKEQLDHPHCKDVLDILDTKEQIKNKKTLF